MQSRGRNRGLGALERREQMELLLDRSSLEALANALGTKAELVDPG